LKRRKKYNDLLEEFENSDKKKAVCEAYKFKKLSKKLKTKLGVSGSSDQVHNQLIAKRREELQSIHNTSNQLDDLF
jgi:predicted GIY-YIG superfamily endonuclease